MGAIEEALMGLADEVTLNPDNVTTKSYSYAETIISNRDNIEDKLSIENVLCEISEHGRWQQKVFMLSVLVHYSNNNKYLIEMISYLLDNINDISLDTLNYLYSQIRIIIFMKPEMSTLQVSELSWKLYDSVMDKYISFYAEELSPIEEPLNDDMVIVFTDQLIGVGHGPTKSALDRCKIIIENMGKKVFLINTAEGDSHIGNTLFYNARIGTYNEEYLKIDKIEWKGTIVPYYQCQNNMPETNEVRSIVSMIKHIRPAYAISIGGGSVVVSLVSKLIPVLTIGMSPSEIQPTKGMCQAYSRELSDEDVGLLQYVGRDRNHVIKAVFGSSIVDAKLKRTKEDIGLDESDFVIVLVGSRIPKEADEEFWSMVDKCNIPNLRIIILGCGQDEIQPGLKGFPNLVDKVYALGMQDDPLGYMSIADIYVNPTRRGGGTSCVEAMSLGIPVITTNYGDVAVNVGESFTVDTYDDMKDEIEKYSRDLDYYKNKSDMATERASVLLNAEQSFVDMINEFKKRIKLPK